ncbi:MAG: hypothetical protein IPH75_04310 [bacterium]|nr:hypothetical protein [bacterium]
MAVNSRMIQSNRIKIFVLIGLTSLTVAIHYGWVLENLFGHSEWVHALHSRFCYLPIMVAAAWFGLRGGVIAATVISVAIMPYLFGAVATNANHMTSLSQELIEIFFYYTIGILIGLLVDREILIRKRQERTQLELERSHRLSLVGQMAAGVAHEIKNPLASIKGAVEILSEESTASSDREEFKQIVVGEIKRIDGTIQEFLEFARPKETRLVPLNLSNSLQASLRQTERQIKEAGLTVRTAIAPDIWIKGDQEKIHQVVLNLLLNAIEASSAGSSIEVSLSESADSGASLTIRDHGHGIEPASRARIFEPFYTTKASGTGLGLAIVRSIIDAHGGTIELAFPEDGGVELLLSFPSITVSREATWR